MLERARTILRIPDWLVDYMRDAIDQSARKKEPLDLARLVRRTMLARDVLRAARLLAEQEADDYEEPAEAAAPLAAEDASNARDEDDGDMAAEAESATAAVRRSRRRSRRDRINDDEDTQ